MTIVGLSGLFVFAQLPERSILYRGGIAILIKRMNIQKRLCYLLLFSGIIVAIVLLLITTKNVVGNAFLAVVWLLPTYAIIIGLFGTEQEPISRAIFQNKYVLFLGAISLELFLVHQLVIRYVIAFARRIDVMSSFVYLIAFIITILTAKLLYNIKSWRI